MADTEIVVTADLIVIVLAVIAEVGEGVMELPVVWPVTLVQSVEGVVGSGNRLIVRKIRSYFTLQGVGLLSDREGYRVGESNCGGWKRLHQPVRRQQFHFHLPTKYW